MTGLVGPFVFLAHLDSPTAMLAGQKTGDTSRLRQEADR
jgi:hypothetical protein